MYGLLVLIWLALRKPNRHKPISMFFHKIEWRISAGGISWCKRLEPGALAISSRRWRWYPPGKYYHNYAIKFFPPKTRSSPFLHVRILMRISENPTKLGSFRLLLSLGSQHYLSQQMLAIPSQTLGRLHPISISCELQRPEGRGFPAASSSLRRHSLLNRNCLHCTEVWRSSKFFQAAWHTWWNGYVIFDCRF